MELNQNLEAVQRSYETDVRLIRDFALSTYASLNPQMGADGIELTEQDLESLDLVIAALKKMSEDIQQGNDMQPSGTSMHIKSEKVGNLILGYMRPYRQQGMLTEMTIVYLMAKFESFVKDYLEILLASKAFLLKSKKQLRYDEILTYSSMEQLVRDLAKRETEELGHGSIDDVAQHFNAKFNIDLETSDSWDVVREAHYRRNIIVHNGGRTNNIYEVKTFNLSRKSLVTDDNYVKEVASGVLELIEFISDNLSTKFKLAEQPRS